MVDFLYLLIVLGSMQGIIISCLLLASRKSTYAERLLALIILITALPGFHLYLHYKDVFSADGIRAIIHAAVPWILITALGPLILFYVKAVTDPHFRIGWKQAIWFLPVIIDLFPKAVELGHLASFFAATDAEIAHFSDLYNKYADIPRWMIMVASIYIAGKWLRDYQKSEKDLVQKRTDAISWLFQFLKIFRYFLVLWLAFLIPYVLPVSDLLLQTVGWFPVYIPLAIMIYWLGIRGYLSGRNADSRETSPNERKTAIKETEMTAIIDQLTRLMLEKKLYLDHELDLAGLSAASDIPTRSISFSLNQQLGKTFNQYLNEFRVEEFKQRSASLKDLSIAGLAAICGFSSLATFQRVFKQTTGKTPSEYLRQTAS